MRSVVAWTDAPGVAIVAQHRFGGQGGYAFATSGEEIVVSDGSSLHVISYEGEDLGTLGGNQPIGGVYWISDTIYYLQIGEDAALKSTSLDGNPVGLRAPVGALAPSDASSTRHAASSQH